MGWESAATAGAGRNAGTAFAVRTRDGLNLSAMRYGNPEAPAVVFVHGLNQSRLCWDRQLVLADRFHLITFDLRGHGDSDKPTDPARYMDDALWGDDLAAVLRESGATRPVIVAWSMGGYVTGQYLRRHGPGAIAGINLVDAVTTFEAPYRTGASAEIGAQLGSSNLAVRSAATAAFLKLTFARQPTPDDLHRMLVYNGMVPRALHQGLVKLSTEGLDAAYAAAPAMLVSHGARDALVRPTIAMRMRAINAASCLSLYPDAGHSPFWEAASRFNTELAAYRLAAGKAQP